MSCDKLRCFDCDKKVLKYSNSKWKSSVDYLFVRNHLTNPKELVKGIEPELGSNAYACQCKFRSMSEPSHTEAITLKWMCAGH